MTTKRSIALRYFAACWFPAYSRAAQALRLRSSMSLRSGSAALRFLVRSTQPCRRSWRMIMPYRGCSSKAARNSRMSAWRHHARSHSSGSSTAPRCFDLLPMCPSLLSAHHYPAPLATVRGIRSYTRKYTARGGMIRTDERCWMLLSKCPGAPRRRGKHWAHAIAVVALSGRTSGVQAAGLGQRRTNPPGRERQGTAYGRVIGGAFPNARHDTAGNVIGCQGLSPSFGPRGWGFETLRGHHRISLLWLVKRPGPRGRGFPLPRP